MIKILRCASAVLLVTTSAWAQCARCGEAVFAPGPPVTVIFRSLKAANPLPGALGSGSLTLRAETSSPSNQVPATEYVFDYTVSAPVTITAIEIYQGPEPGNGIPVLSLGITPSSPLRLSGKGAVVRQTAGSIDPGISYSVLVRTSDHPEGASLGALVAAPATIALAPLQPASGQNATATGALTANIARDAAGTIGSAELRFDVHYRFTAPGVHVTRLLVRAGGPNGPIVFNAGLTSSAPAGGGEVSLSARQLVDSSDTAAFLALQTLVLDPSALYMELDSDSAVGPLGGTLAKPESVTFLTTSSAVPGTAESARATAAGNLTLYVVRAANGTASAALAVLDLAHQGFAPGSVFFGISNPSAGTLSFDPAWNVLTAPASGQGILYQFFALLPDSSLLSGLLSTLRGSTFPLFLDTLSSPSGGVLLPLFPLGTLQPAQGILTGFAHSVSTPGSIVSVFGQALPPNPVLFIGGTPATILHSEPTQINAIVPDNAVIGLNQVRVVTSAASGFPDLLESNPLNLLVDVVEPWIFTDPSGPAILDSSTQTLVRQNAPASAGDTILVYCTGLSAKNTVTYFALIDGPFGAPVTPVKIAPGVWQVPIVLTGQLAISGLHTLQIVGRVDAGFQFPSDPVDVWIK